MSEERFTPEEFARWMALPEDHPERRAHAGSPRVEAWHAMHQAFIRDEAAADPAATTELASRLERSLGLTIPHDSSEAPPVRAVRAATDGWSLRGLFTLVRRPAFAFATLAVIAAGAASSWWVYERAHTPAAMRGESSRGFLIAEPLETPEGLLLTWPAIAGADEYRVILLGADLTERGRIEGLRKPEVALTVRALSGSLPADGELQVEIIALRAGDPLATSSARTIHLR